MDIEQIVGPKVYARLQAAKLTNENVLKGLGPEELMALAGIGPKTAQKIFTALHKKTSESQLNNIYEKMTMRTRLKNVMERAGKFVKDPEPAIDTIENMRRIAQIAQNMAASAWNLGKPSNAQKLPMRKYEPIPLILDPFAFSFERPEYNLLVEVHLKIEEENLSITVDEINVLTNGISNSSIHNIQSLRLSDSHVIHQILEYIDQKYLAFRKQSSYGYFYIIMGTKMEDLATIIREDMEKYNDDRLQICDSQQSYFVYDILYRYAENPIFKKQENVLSKFMDFYSFEDYRKDHPKTSFDSFKNKNVKERIFDQMLDNAKSHITIHTVPKVIYGIIEGYPHLENFLKEFVPLPDERVYYTIIPQDFTAFEIIAKETPYIIGGFQIPRDIMCMIGNTLSGMFKLWKGKYENILVFQSQELNKFGFIIEVKK